MTQKGAVYHNVIMSSAEHKQLVLYNYTVCVTIRHEGGYFYIIYTTVRLKGERTMKKRSIVFAFGAAVAAAATIAGCSGASTTTTTEATTTTVEETTKATTTTAETTTTEAETTTESTTAEETTKAE